MAFFPRSCFGPDPSFTPLFRLLDDFDSYSREAQGGAEAARRPRRQQPVRTFTPKFDVRETEAAYELHGDLPGIERDDLHIEFTDPQTVVVRGRVERGYTAAAGTPAGAIEDVSADAPAESGGDKEAEASSAPSHRATVSDEETESLREQGALTPATTPGAPEAATPAAADRDGGRAPEKYWLSERSVGEFARSFHFPSRVEQEAVSANLNNGVLSVTVPKAKKHEARRIAIQ